MFSLLLSPLTATSSNSDITRIWDVAENAAPDAAAPQTHEERMEKQLERVSITESSLLSRPRTRSDDFGDDKGHFRPEGLATILQNIEQKNGAGGGGGGGRRWSESGSSSHQHHQEGSVAVGSTVKVLVDYRPVREDEAAVGKGQAVRVTAADPERGAYKVAAATGAEGWVPSYVLTLLSSSSGASAASRKTSATTWNIRSKFRRPSFGRKDSRGIAEQVTASVTTAAARAGETGVLKCARAPGAVSSVRWSRTLPGQQPGLQQLLSPGVGGVGSGKYSFEHGEHQGVAAMYVANCEAADAGEYRCVQQMQQQGQEVVAVIHLKVKGG